MSCHPALGSVRLAEKIAICWKKKHYYFAETVRPITSNDRGRGLARENNKRKIRTLRLLELHVLSDTGDMGAAPVLVRTQLTLVG